jgi:hypothetical protein
MIYNYKDVLWIASNIYFHSLLVGIDKHLLLTQHHMESMKAMSMKQKSCDVATSKVIDMSEVKLVETSIALNSI